MKVETYVDRAAFEALPYDFADIGDADRLGYGSVAEFVEHRASELWGPDGIPTDAELEVHLWRRADCFDEMARIAASVAERSAEDLDEALREECHVDPENSDPDFINELRMSIQAATVADLRRLVPWLCEPFACRTYSRAEVVGILRAEGWEERHLAEPFAPARTAT